MFAPAFICARYLLGLCFRDLPDIDQFRLVVLTVLTNDYKMAKDLPLSNRIDPNGSDFMIPPLHRILVPGRVLKTWETRTFSFVKVKERTRVIPTDSNSRKERGE